jgi:hypothetical protein
MEFTPTDCSCWRLTAALTNSDELPDHVCLETLLATVYQTPSHELSLASEPVWPVPIRGRLLGLVLRQWAQEPPRRTLARQLELAPEWQDEVSYLRREYEAWQRRRPPEAADRRRQAWLAGEGYDLDRRTPRGYWVDRASNRWLSERLLRRGLPGTPATVDHLRARSATLQMPLPARGILITIYIYVRFDQPGGGWVPDDYPEMNAAAPLEWVTGPLWGIAFRVVQAHRDWIRQWRPHPLTDISTVRRAAPGRLPSRLEDTGSQFDYLTEVTHDLSALRAKLQRAHVDRQGLIRRHIDACYRRVLARRQRHHIEPPAPPDDFRDQAYQQIEAQLAGS